MAFSIRPVDNEFFSLFQDSANHLVVGVGLLAEMFGSDVDRHAVAKRMREAEREADKTVRAIVTRVNHTFVTPFDREDIYALANELDDVMDLVDDAADMIDIYGITSFPEEIAKQVEVLSRLADLTVTAMPKLRSLKGLEEYWAEVNRLEHSGDKAHRRILAALFGGDYDPMDVMKFKDVAECLENAINGFEKVASTVEQIAVKES